MLGHHADQIDGVHLVLPEQLGEIGSQKAIRLMLDHQRGIPHRRLNGRMQIGADAAGLEEGRASGCLMLYDHDQIVVAVRGLDQYQRTLECFLRAFQREVNRPGFSRQSSAV